jgi:hypothetical protein
MAVVGVVDSMVAARENATKYGYGVSPNRELVALGASNLAASLVTATGTLPIYGSLTREFTNRGYHLTLTLRFAPQWSDWRSHTDGWPDHCLALDSCRFLHPSFTVLPSQGEYLDYILESNANIPGCLGVDHYSCCLQQCVNSSLTLIPTSY